METHAKEVQEAQRKRKVFINDYLALERILTAGYVTPDEFDVLKKKIAKTAEKHAIILTLGEISEYREQLKGIKKDLADSGEKAKRLKMDYSNKLPNKNTAEMFEYDIQELRTALANIIAVLGE